jgi:RNA polymerase sigma-70 factor (ECF subfamily)
MTVDLEPHRGELLRYVRRRIADHATAEDLVQDTFVRALAGLAGFTDQGRGVGPWLATIAHNTVVNHQRSATSRRVRPVELAELDRALPSAGDPADEVVSRERAAAVRAALADLSPRRRSVLTARFLAGLSVVETAAALGVSQATVTAATHAGLRQLARHPRMAALNA